jgi:hypothetical protein
MPGLLNPTQDAALAQKLLRIAGNHLQKQDAKLLGNAMEERTYLQTIGARRALHALIEELQHAYDNEMKV